MRNFLIFSVITTMLTGIMFLTGCKTSEEAVEAFTIQSTSGYSKIMTTLDPDDKGVTSMTLYFSLKNAGTVNGTITGWSFKIKRDIVTLVEVNNTNYNEYNLVLTGSMNVSSESANEIVVGTPQPFVENSLSSDILSFEDNIPTRVIVEINVTDENGESRTLESEGTYTYETGVIDESKYNIIGEWDFTRTVNNAKQQKQKIVFTGTKVSGTYTVFNSSNKVFESGSYTVSKYKVLYFVSSEGTKYWGLFSDATNMNGTLNIPKTVNDNNNTIDPKTGTWVGVKK